MANANDDDFTRQLKKLQESQRELQMSLGNVDRGMIGLGLGKPCAWCKRDYVDSYGSPSSPQYYGFCSVACINKYRRNNGQPDFDGGSRSHTQTSSSTPTDYSPPAQKNPAPHRAAHTMPMKETRLSGTNKVLLGILLALVVVVLFLVYYKSNDFGEQHRLSVNNSTEVTTAEVPAETTTATTATIKSAKAYFYSKPEHGKHRKQYLVKGDPISVLKSDERFVFAKYTNSRGIVTSGWLLQSDLTKGDDSHVQDVIEENSISKATSPAEVANEHLEAATHLTGNVGNLAATFNLTWAENGTVSGTYFNNKRPSMVYKLRGTEISPGRLELDEYTGDKKTATCTVSIQAGCYEGTMDNTDGRSFSMRMCLE